MGYEFSDEEIQQLEKVARIYSPGFTEAQLQNLLKLNERIKETGYLEAVDSLARLEKEGIPTAQAMAENKALVRRNTELEHRLNISQAKLQNLEEERQKTEAELNKLKDATGIAKKELESLRAARDKEEKELAQFRLEVEKRKANLHKEIEQAQKRTNVTMRDIAAVREIKTEIETHNLNWELVLNLAKEFGNYGNAVEELVVVLKQHQRLREYISSVEQKYEQRKSELQFEFGALQVAKDKTQAEVRSLEASRRHLETLLAKLQDDHAYEEEIRRFHRRYWGVSKLMEYLATWNQVLFLRCDNPISTFTGMLNSSVTNARFWTDQSAMRCPHCGLNMISYDEKPYQDLNAKVGQPLRILLGE